VSLNNTQKPSQVFWKHSIIYLAGWMYEELILPSYFRSTSSALLKLPVHCLLEHSLKPRQHFYLKSQGYSEYKSSCYPQLDLLVANCVRIWVNKKSVPHLEVYSLSILQHLRLVLFSWLHLKNLTNSPQQKARGSWYFAQSITTVSGFFLSQMFIITMFRWGFCWSISFNRRLQSTFTHLFRLDTLQYYKLIPFTPRSSKWSSLFKLSNGEIRIWESKLSRLWLLWLWIILSLNSNDMSVGPDSVDLTASMFRPWIWRWRCSHGTSVDLHLTTRDYILEDIFKNLVCISYVFHACYKFCLSWNTAMKP